MTNPPASALSSAPPRRANAPDQGFPRFFTPFRYLFPLPSVSGPSEMLGLAGAARSGTTPSHLVSSDVGFGERFSRLL
ncbi:hypothetical protein Q8A67_021048 [Cirrhinus molitorella]|uniref:Uncharacterized protein n=1 Tax=Cirrhinus molitorella TaxID=172907 RepID=A0AA88TP96_9TELE|nr:hypothetical protein Q8A67_021048 [Cirrhinus molitorella]